jgi:hypothetical protein
LGSAAPLLLDLQPAGPALIEARRSASVPSDLELPKAPLRLDFRAAFHQSAIGLRRAARLK